MWAYGGVSYSELIEPLDRSGAGTACGEKSYAVHAIMVRRGLCDEYDDQTDCDSLCISGAGFAAEPPKDDDGPAMKRFIDAYGYSIRTRLIRSTSIRRFIRARFRACCAIWIAFGFLRPGPVR